LSDVLIANKPQPFGMSGILENPNLMRRGGPGLLAGVLTPLLKPLLRAFPKPRLYPNVPLSVFQSYLVGDLFMALPALQELGKSIDIQILCRPDCVEILRGLGFKALPFDNAFLTRPTFTTFFRTFSQAWKLRGELGSMALDLDADPRTAFWLKIAGVHTALSFDRAGASLFDTRFAMPPEAVHQADRDIAVVQAFCESRFVGPVGANDYLPLPGQPSSQQKANASWIISCWTRKDTKNWPLDRWEQLLEKMLAANVSFRILEAPDGDEGFKDFRQRWSQRAEFMNGSLADVVEQIRSCAGIVATDNFTGHVAGYFGKPVLWINGSSDARQVLPRGPRTYAVQVDPMPCRPCGHRCANPEYKACLVRLDVDRVWDAFRKLGGN